MSQLQNVLNKVSEKNLEPDEKLKSFIFTRLEAVKEVVKRNGSLSADFFQDIARVEKVRRKFDLQEIQVIKRILNEGIQKKIFHLLDVNLSATVLHFALKGIEVPYIKGIFDGKGVMDRIRHRNEIVNVLLYGIKKAPDFT
jgi:hypothetical protein